MPFLTALAAVALLAQAAPAAGAPAPAPTPVPTAPAAPESMTDNPAITEINRLMETWKGKPGNRLRVALGMSYGSKTASDGEAVFWRQRIDALGCNFVGGQMRCGTGGAAECVLAVGFDTKGAVKTWKVQGATEACKRFVPLIGAAVVPAA